MVQHALSGHLLVLGTRTAVVGIGIDADAAARQEEPQHLNVLGVHETDEIFHDDVDAVLVEIAVIAEREEIELEALRLHHSLVGQIHDLDFSEVGLTGDGTQRGELGTVELHPIVVFLMLILEGLEQRGIIISGILRLSSQ